MASDRHSASFDLIVVGAGHAEEVLESVIDGLVARAG
jgi:hypothetical protein